VKFHKGGIRQDEWQGGNQPDCNRQPDRIPYGMSTRPAGDIREGAAGQKWQYRPTISLEGFGVYGKRGMLRWQQD
jgi:hypothetical protein